HSPHAGDAPPRAVSLRHSGSVVILFMEVRCSLYLRMSLRSLSAVEIQVAGSWLSARPCLILETLRLLAFRGCIEGQRGA
ncbi:MAG: hypothetical protein AAF975_03315, partial [Spirochaetota bacterium]